MARVSSSSSGSSKRPAIELGTSGISNRSISLSLERTARFCSSARMLTRQTSSLHSAVLKTSGEASRPLSTVLPTAVASRHRASSRADHWGVHRVCAYGLPQRPLSSALSAMPQLRFTSTLEAAIESWMVRSIMVPTFCS